ncbi:MAG: folylpolyglutamate synthase/dihydrofolate synthase family protein [Candidatus Poribacteria bacterium]
MITYEQAIEYLESFIDYERLSAPYDPNGWKLERVERLLELVGNPHLKLKVIHIAGTKGKGSTSAIVASILKSAGYKVGLYTSPHLVTFRERIVINDDMIPKEQVCEMVEYIKPYVEKLQKEDNVGILSFFDVYTAIAMLFFEFEKVDFVVLEVGMGGRLDATNVVNPLVSVITPISYDHILILGDTLTAIAGEKAGIIKENGYVVTSPQEPEALKVIKDTCEKKNAILFQVGEDIIYEKTQTGAFSEFGVYGIFGKYDHLMVQLLGEHQIINATTAVGAIECLRFYGIKIPLAGIKSGMFNIKWKARVEVVQYNPIIILDVAHNSASAKALSDTIKKTFGYQKLILIFGISLHKDVKGMGEYLCPIADKIILTKINNPRAMTPEAIKEELLDFCDDFIITQDTQSAIQIAKSIATPLDLICITGSFYLAGEAMRVLNIGLYDGFDMELAEPRFTTPSEGE